MLKKIAAEPATIENINVESSGSIFTIMVKVAAVRKFRVGTNVTVKDNNGAMDLTIFDSEMEKIADPNVRDQITQVGNEFQIVVLVDAYRGKPQLKIHRPERPESIKKLSRVGGPAQEA